MGVEFDTSSWNKFFFSPKKVYLDTHMGVEFDASSDHLLELQVEKKNICMRGRVRCLFVQTTSTNTTYAPNGGEGGGPPIYIYIVYLYVFTYIDRYICIYVYIDV